MVLAAITVSYYVATAPQPSEASGLHMVRTAARRTVEPEPAPLAEGSLEFPVLLLSRVRLQDSFRDPRANGERTHEAIDIMAPRFTPVRAASDGVVARLSSGGAGGLAIYQLDPTGGYYFYYAHLEAYAPGVKEGLSVRRGDVIGYVGTTGNAPRTAPHLHFAIYRVRDRHRWWAGRAINPYPLLKLSASASSPAPQG
jgi:murein DD-endopeptidase MepM/ murein hydrolase activator NlpD